MAENTLEDDVSPAAAPSRGKTLEERFREQAELIDRLFAYRFAEFDQRWNATLDVRLAALEDALESRLETNVDSNLETKLNGKLEPIRRDLAVIKHTAKVILSR